MNIRLFLFPWCHKNMPCTFIYKFLCRYIFNFVSIYPGVKFLGHVINFCLIFEEEIFCLFLMMFPFIWRKLHLHFANGFSFLVYWVLLSWIHVNINWKECCWSWSFNTLATLCKEPKANSFIWWWERLKAKGEGGSRGWDD